MGLLLGTMACGAIFYGTKQPVSGVMSSRWHCAGCWWRGVVQVHDVMVVFISSLIIVPYSIIIMFLFRGGTCDSDVRTKTELVAVELNIGQSASRLTRVEMFNQLCITQSIPTHT